MPELGEDNFRYAYKGVVVDEGDNVLWACPCEPAHDSPLGARACAQNHRARVSRSKIVAEWDPTDQVWFCMWANGAVTAEPEAAEVVRKVRARGRRVVGRTGGIDLSTIEWRNVPAGFRPPEG